MESISRRVLTLLQLTRMALVFTALADSGCELLLWGARQAADSGTSLWRQLDPAQCVAMAVTSIGLYGFGMSLNDIIDRRRDTRVSPNRPLPSGRIGIATAHIVCALLVLMGIVGGEIYSTIAASPLSLMLVVFTAALITFYDFAGKYLVAPGLLSLGLIRFFHATVAAPSLPVLWHPLLLLNHVTIVSTIAYHWEQKRPALRPVHWWSVFLGLGGFDALAIGLVWWRRHARYPLRRAVDILSIKPALLGPALAVAVFIFLAILIRRRNANQRDAGQTLMLAGLLWLIVYDACFVTEFVGIPEGFLLLILLPMAYFSVVVMRWWSTLMLLSQRPTFKRVET
jgi:4-hydroxybenzoate polyprenyltransferase